MPETTMSDWDPTVPGVRVRLADNPGRQGLTTGRVMQRADRLFVEVQFGPSEIVFKPKATLEPCSPTRLLPLEALRRGQFGTPADLGRLLTFEKVRGRLTNVLYSMESSNTDFYPHQFKPVLRFLDSPDGRLLIADEVGLGKTIEAVYIWKELQAREGAQRLLIVCPAMLQEKWRLDLRMRFNILADILTADELKERLDAFAHVGNRLAFTCICSLESLRPSSEWEDEANTSVRAQLARLLDRTPATSIEGLFDLVIVDEAHYLRNPATASNRLARLLREASRHLVLLTATPVQLRSDNLYQLLRLVSPEFFTDPFVFDLLLEANRPVVAALRHLWSHPAQLREARAEIERALGSAFLATNPMLRSVHAALESGQALTNEQRARLGHQLETASVLGQYLSRTRKRDVIERRVERVPQVLTVRFTDAEREVYDRVTEQIRKRANRSAGVHVFVEIARQRRMASCLVAALSAWDEDGDLDELLWGDLGVSEASEAAEGGDKPPTREGGTEGLKPLADLKELERHDSKYHQVRACLRGQLDENPREKFVVFAYYRGTIAYLKRRLEADGIRAVVIQGGMGDEKWQAIDQFRSPAGPSVLLSSEVGSEGIDLQFSRFIINYDLPWNPMKVEQRIGRIDRLGQAADRIFIINFALKDSIEDRVLQRLYERIRIFRESVGDLEEILGQETERLLVELFTEELDEDQLERRVDQIALALANKRSQQDRLEEEAINLLAFSDYIREAVQQSRQQGRWLQPAEMRAFVEDFFRHRYPGSAVVQPEGPEVFQITLSATARTDLEIFLSTYQGVRATNLHHGSQVPCFFEPKQAGVMGRRLELIDQTHPLIQWIRSCYEAQDEYFHPVAAMSLGTDVAGVQQGHYVYATHKWTFLGLRRESRMVSVALDLDTGAVVEPEVAERLVATAARTGVEFPNALRRLELARLVERIEQCEGALLSGYLEAVEQFSAENGMRCDVQLESALAFHARRANELRARIERFRQGGKLSLLPPTEGLLRKVDQELEVKRKRVEVSRQVEEAFVPLAVGYILVVPRRQ